MGEGVRTLRERGGSPSYNKAFANDLVGTRIMPSAALLASKPKETEWEELRR